MTRRVFVDADIILDLLLAREPFFTAAAELFLDGSSASLDRLPVNLDGSHVSLGGSSVDGLPRRHQDYAVAFRDLPSL